MRLNLRILLFITLLAASVGIGTVGVHASTDCQHLFHAYQKQLAKHLHHKVSPETLARWAAWNKAHPHYRPTRKEAMDKINFVCEVPMDDSGIAEDLPPVALPPMLPTMTDLFPAPVPPDVLVSNVVPVDNPLQPPMGNPQFGPVYYPGPPTNFNSLTPPTPPIAATPEPPSLLLMTTAVGLMLTLVFRKREQSSSLVRRATLS